MVTSLSGKAAEVNQASITQQDFLADFDQILLFLSFYNLKDTLITVVR